MSDLLMQEYEITRVIKSLKSLACSLSTETSEVELRQGLKFIYSYKTS